MKKKRLSKFFTFLYAIIFNVTKKSSRSSKNFFITIIDTSHFLTTPVTRKHIQCFTIFERHSERDLIKLYNQYIGHEYT